MQQVLLHKQFAMAKLFEGYASSGTFVDTFANAGANGCDSIRILNLTVSSLPAVPTITQSGNTLTSSTATQYQWYLNGNLLPGETNQTLIITTNGVYTVQVTNGASCSILSTPFNAIFNGINQVNTNIHVNIFPNPTNGIVNLLFSNFPNAENISIRLYNEVGQQVVDKIIAVSGKNFSLVQSLQEFSAGVYFIQLQQGTWIYGERILRSN